MYVPRKNVYIYNYVYIFNHIYLYISIYIIIEGERKRERETVYIHV